ncbi:hypothetical protein PhCBS80983_g04241 [Powellomyces hirtus]|uniref:Uncharacterized protein n=1 Tax=Powellomyces hirtus TaxID=109895 RepID=A0A507E162_9FUNG|nr:hypothetical protein PhCBS80983_g04241 [Powellomyces hirtus]
MHAILHANTAAIFRNLQSQYIDPVLNACYLSANGAIPFSQYDIDVESRCRRGGTTGDDNAGGDPGAVYYYLLRRQRKVVEGAAAVVKRLAGDARATRDLLANSVRMSGKEGVCADAGSATGITDENHLRPWTTRELGIEALRAVLLLQWTVETLRLFGCSATKGSKSSPGHSLIGCKYVRWILADLHVFELRVIYWAVLNLDGHSFTHPSTKWRSDAQGFEVGRFEMVFLRPCLKKCLKDRGGDIFDDYIG